MSTEVEQLRQEKEEASVGIAKQDTVFEDRLGVMRKEVEVLRTSSEESGSRMTSLKDEVAGLKQERAGLSKEARGLEARE